MKVGDRGAFNTRRMYTEAGQRIGWVITKIVYDPDYDDGVFDIHEVVFYDIDRGINGLVAIFGAVTNQKVLQAYDEGGYGYPGYERREAENTAREIAAQV
jgi:hypothetical protein